MHDVCVVWSYAQQRIRTHNFAHSDASPSLCYRYSFWDSNLFLNLIHIHDNSTQFWVLNTFQTCRLRIRGLKRRIQMQDVSNEAKALVLSHKFYSYSKDYMICGLGQNLNIHNLNSGANNDSKKMAKILVKYSYMLVSLVSRKQNHQARSKATLDKRHYICLHPQLCNNDIHENLCTVLHAADEE